MGSTVAQPDVQKRAARMTSNLLLTLPLNLGRVGNFRFEKGAGHATI
jgi:hypothetical protein